MNPQPASPIEPASRVIREPVDLRDPDQAELAYRVAVAWRELRRGAATAALRDHFLGAGPEAIDQGQMDALDVLVTRANWKMSEFADAMRVEASTATRTIGRLVDTGLAERHSCSNDARVVRVSATRAGRARQASVAARRSRALSRLLGAFDPAERVMLAELLERFVTAIDELVADLDADRGAHSSDPTEVTDATATDATATH